LDYEIKVIKPTVPVPGRLNVSNALTKMLMADFKQLNKLDECRSLLDAAVIAWNLCVIRKIENNDLLVIKNFIEKYNTLNMNAELKKIIDHFIEKKERLYPNDKQLIAIWDLRIEKNNFFITAGLVTNTDGNELAG
jgi:hypothetical protein